MKGRSDRSLLNPTERELRQALSLLCADALANTWPISKPVRFELQRIMRRLCLSDPLTVDDERDFTRALLEAGADLTPPFIGRALGRERAVDTTLPAPVGASGEITPRGRNET